MWAEEYDSLDKMASGVNAIALGTLETVRPGSRLPTASGTPLVFTPVDIRIEEAIRGDLGSSITVENAIRQLRQ